MSDFSLSGRALPADLHIAGTVLGMPLCYVLAALLGLIIGSFLSVVVYRLPIMLQSSWERECRLASQAQCAAAEAEAGTSPAAAAVAATAAAQAATVPATVAPRYDLCRPGSACTACERPLRAHEKIPVLSYLILRGRCASCHAPIGLTYPVLELLSALLAVLSLWHYGPSWQAVSLFGFAASLLALAFIDARTQLLPDAITLPLVWAGLLVNLGGTFVAPDTAIVGAAAGYLSLWAVYWLFRALTGKEGIGYGDFKLFAAIGAWLGWQWLPAILLMAAVCGALAAALAMMRGRMRADQPLPFGPFLAGAALLAAFGATPLTHWLGG